MEPSAPTTAPSGGRPTGKGRLVARRKTSITADDDEFEILARSPLTALDMEGRFNVVAKVKGGGLSGQAGAVKLGVARALIEYDTELRPPLKREGYLTRDARIKERKKYGRKKARRGFQFVKR